jgi:hypothetical protein
MTRGCFRRSVVYISSFLCSSSTIMAHPTCVFLSLVDDTHIVGPASDVLLFFCDYRRNLAH